MRFVWAAVVLALASPQSVRADQAWIPTSAIALGSVEQRVSAQLGATEHSFSRRELRPGLVLGLVHPVPQPWPHRVPLEGHVSFGFGSTLVTGNLQLSVREDWVATWQLQPWFGVRAGLGAGFVLDTYAADRNQLEIGLPIGVKLGDLEIVYRPNLSIPISRQSERVYGGQLSRGASFALIPFELVLRMRWSGLAW